MAKSKKDRGLGRGLSSLMADIETDAVSTGEQAAIDSPKDSMLPIEKLHGNPDQPRKDFAEGDLAELASSIKARGVIQPILVRPDPKKSGHFQIVAGERRWRAAQMAQLHEVPVVIRDMDDQELMEVAIIENIQRADLNAVEEALGYRALMDSFGHTQEQLSEALGKSRSHIANLLRLLNLPEAVQKLLRAGDLSAGHARTLVGHENAAKLARQIVDQGLSVRDAEKLAKAPATTAPSAPKAKAEKDSDTKALEADLKAHLKMKVLIDHKQGGQAGHVTISYKDLDQLDQLCALLSATK